MIMKNKLSKIIIFISIFLGIVVLQNTVKAESISISASSSSVQEDGSVTITISGDCTGRINLSTTNGSLSESSVWIENNSQSVTLSGLNSGDAVITATPATVSDANGNDIRVSAKSCTVKVAEKNSGDSGSSSSSDSNGSSSSNNTSGSNSNKNDKTTTSKKSSNANLSNLGITPNDFSGFTPSKTSYSVSVPNDVTTVSIYANKGQSDQTISGTGSKTLQEGTNTFEVVVTAEDGTKKTYTLNITRETATENETENETANETANETTGEITQTGYTIGLKSLTISGVELSPSFSTGVYQYTAKLIGDRTTLDINAIALDENQKIEITGNEDLKEGENVITIIVTNAENTGSSENTTNTLNETTEETVNNTVTYQIIVNKSLVDEEAIARENAQKEQQKRTIIITILGVAIAIVVIILIVRYVRHRGEAEDFDGLYLPEEDNNYDDNFSNSNYSDNLGNEQQYDEDANKDFDLDQDNDGYEEHKSKRKGKRFK